MKNCITSLSSAADTGTQSAVPVLRAPYDKSITTLDLGTPAAHSYLLSFFALDRKAFDGDIVKFVKRNEYLIWRPVPSSFSSSLASSMSPFSTLYLRDTTTESGDARNMDTATTPAALAGMYEALLTTGIPNEAWESSSSGGALEEKVNALCQRIFAQSPSSETTAPDMKLWGYHFLRWMLFAGKPGPAMVPSMLLLGREEVLKRVYEAGTVAKRWQPAEKDMAPKP